MSVHLGPESIPNLHFNYYNKGSYSTPLCNILVNLRELSVNEEGKVFTVVLCSHVPAFMD